MYCPTLPIAARADKEAYDIDILERVTDNDV